MIKEFNVGKYYYIKKEHANEVKALKRVTTCSGKYFVDMLVDSPSECVYRGTFHCDCRFDNEFEGDKKYRCFMDFLLVIDEYIPQLYVQEEMEL